MRGVSNKHCLLTFFIDFSYHNRVDLFIDDQLVYKDIYHLSSQSTVSLQDAMKQFQVKFICYFV